MELLFGTLIFVSMELLYGNYHKSLLVQVCVGKILIKVFLVGLSWNLKLIEVVLFRLEISSERGQKGPISVQARSRFA